WLMLSKVVENEDDALHLENSLIKEYQPRYNVLLKDDKSYPWIVVKNEHFPRVFLTRNVIRDGSKYYGPYSNVHLAKMVLELIRTLYPVRTCKLSLTPENIKRGKFSVCLQYHIKNCNGCCEGLISEEKYLKNISHIKQILSGHTQELSNHLKTEMMRLSDELLFEEAQILKEKYLLLENYKAKSVIVNMSIHNIDVFSYIDDTESAFINYLHIVNGSIVQCYTIEYKKRLDEAKESLLSLGIIELRERFKSLSREIIVPFLPETELPNITFIIPQKGDKKKLLDVSEQNAKQYKADRLKQREKLTPNKGERILYRLKQDFRLEHLPVHIECFDNSNIQGTNPVASCVVFKNAKPSKRDYRHFNVKTVIGPDDFASMQEIVYRRYKRLLDEEGELPQLIIIDGGKGQLNAAVSSLKTLGLIDKIAIAGIAKRLEEIYFPEDPIPLYLDKNSESLKLVQRLRDEAHRFGITFHRQKRSKSQITSVLDSINGIGEKTKTLLLTHYKSIKKINESSENELAELIGKSKANILYKNLHLSE
ncbi:MAG: excinuclease ABC subunit UvrC, partial [Bacteroidaceae bacterium]|nr:excinuclease ABC subunit UvrC [Bacteroidaceae bacterium]